MEEVYAKIQVYLIKKDKECDTLRFLTSRTTSLNAEHVSDVCNTIKAILQDAQAIDEGVDSRPISTNEKCIQNFKFLLLNTDFKAQEHLCEDITNGHLVDMCPPLSPFLFMQIIWTLSYEEILCNSILFMPMDLCTEVLNILCRCVMDLEFHGALNLISKIIINCFKKLSSALHQDIQVLDTDETLKRFLGSIQELILLVGTLQSKSTTTITKRCRYERYGLVMIRALNILKECIINTRTEKIILSEHEALEKLYKITFGRDFMARLDMTAVRESTDLFLDELIQVLLGHAKKIDCNMYLEWAEIDFSEDTSKSIQRVVGLACYHFLEFLGTDYEPEKYQPLIECLQQLSSRPDAPFAMSLAELCSEVDKGDDKCLRTLIERFRDWDYVTVDFLDKTCAMIQRDDCLSLLNIAAEFVSITASPQAELCPEVHALALKVLLGQKLVDMMEIVTSFIIIHNASRALETTSFDSSFESYVNQGIALGSCKTSLRVLLFYLIQNPRKVLSTLIKAAISCPKYAKSVVLPEDLCYLSPIMQIVDDNQLSLLANALYTTCSEELLTGSSKKFIDLVQVLLQHNVLTADQLLNDVFVPVLRNDTIPSNILPILTCVRNIRERLTLDIRKTKLLHTLALTIRSLRGNTSISFYQREEMLDLLRRTIQHFTKNGVTSDNGTDLLTQELEVFLEPLDRIYFTPGWDWIKNENSLPQVLEDYRKRCHHIMNQSKDLANRCIITDEFLSSQSLELIDLLQHLILRCTESEYLRFAKEAVIIHWDYFGWDNELDAYSQFSLATIKVCNHYLESFDLMSIWEFSVHKFVSLIKNLANLTSWFISIDAIDDYEFVYRSLVAAMNTLSLESSNLNLSTCYNEFRRTVSPCTDEAYSYETITELVSNVVKLGDQCLLECTTPVVKVVQRSISESQFYIKFMFITICLNWPIDENRLLLSKINEKLYKHKRH
ncbi:uncharacterized protein LOC105688100 isoform X1 [Athalia rosae]|uniref:uncharacterized protein LOC105688100 isoform X1 n=1 Tax=Athalia rosae TaxID=37344 RepID=UPI00203369C1|nr:uncharacterized protein LOC105688100 isoform X1 [Athalia rosae]